jgi:hypothetical protein
VLDAAQAPGTEGTDRVARFARALGRALDELPRPASGETTNLQADLFVQLADVLGPVDRAAALVAAERAVRTSPDHEPAQEKLERLAIEARDADAYARGFAGIEEQIEGAHNKWAFAYRQGRTLETEFARNDLALAAYMRALNYQPRSGAVLKAIERLAKLLGNQDALIEAYRLLAGASDGAQRAYWRSRLAALGVVGKVDDQDSGWGDLLDESAPTGRSAMRGAAVAPPPAKKPGEPIPAKAAPPPTAAPAAPPPAPPAAPAAFATPAATAAKETSSGEPARGIEEAILRATPALGIPILNLPPYAFEPTAAAAPAAPLPAPPRRPTPTPAAPPIQLVPAAAPRGAIHPAIPAPSEPTIEAEPAAPPPAPPPRLQRAARSLPPAPAEALPVAPAKAKVQFLATILPSHAPETSPAAAPPAAAPTAPPPVVPERTATGVAAPAQDEAPSKDVSWLDDEVEMIIEYPTRRAARAAPAAKAAPVATKKKKEPVAVPPRAEALTAAVAAATAATRPEPPAPAPVAEPPAAVRPATPAETVPPVEPPPAPPAAVVQAVPEAALARAAPEPPPGPAPATTEPPADAATIPAEPREAQAVVAACEDKPAPPSRTRKTSTSVPAIAIGEPEEVREARVRLEADATDLEALRVLRDHWHAGGSTIAAWAADSVQAVFDPAVAPVMPPAAIPTLAEVALSRCGPWDARFMHRAMAVVWEHCASTFAEELPSRVRPAQQVSPLGAEPLSRAIAECSDKLAFFRFQVYRQTDGDEVHVLRTRPPSVLVGGSVDPTKPLDRTRLAVAVARCVPEHLLPSTLSPMEREALLQGLLCAFGPPGCVPRIAQRAATVAQDLWHFVPARVQAMMRTELAAADVADTGAWLTEVHARCLLLGVRVSRDLRGAVRLGLSLDAAIPPERPLGEAEFREGLRWSSVTRRLLRAVLSEGFWQGFGR